MTPNEIGKRIRPGVALTALAILAMLTLLFLAALSVTANSVLASAPPGLPGGTGAKDVEGAAGPPVAALAHRLNGAVPRGAPTDTPTITPTPDPCAPAWSVVPSPNLSSSNQLHGVAVVSASDVWAVGSWYYGGSNANETLTEHWNGTSWSVVTSPNVGFGENVLYGVSVVSAGDIWAVGHYRNGCCTDQTLIEHWNGTVWSVVSSPNVGTGTNYLNGVAAVSASDVWAVGYYVNGSDIYQTLIEHWDGTAWSVIASPNQGTGSNQLYGVEAVSASDVWAVGRYDNVNNQTLIEHWDGTVWSVVSSPNVGTGGQLYGVSAVSASDVWAVGYYAMDGIAQTLTEHWNGTAWSVVSSPNQGTNLNQLNGVSAVSASDVWAIGAYDYGSFTYQTLIEHWNGTSWSVVSSPNVGVNSNLLYGVAAVSANDVWAVGNESTSEALIERYTSSCATPTSTPTDTPAITPTFTNTPTITPTPDPCAPAWSVVSSPDPGTYDNHLNGVAAISANDMWAVGYYCCSGGVHQTLIEHWNGTAWSVVSSPNVGVNSNVLYGVAAVSANDVWAVGLVGLNSTRHQTLIEHWNGTAWSVVPSPNLGTNNNDLYGVAAVSASDVWAVGMYYDYGNAHQTLIERWNGTAWSVMPSPNPAGYNYLQGVAAVSASDVWAVGYYYDYPNAHQTLIEHWNGTDWSVVPSPNVGTGWNELYGVEAVSASDVWAVGYYNINSGAAQTLTERWNGTAWSVVSSPNQGTSSNYLQGVAAVSANDVWAVGYYSNSSTYQTLIEHWNGTAWSVVSSPNPDTNSNLYGVAAVSASDVWAVGYYTNAGVGQTLTEHYTSSCATTLVGHVTWQGLPDQPSIDQQMAIRLSLKSGATQVDYPTQLTDPSGFFTVTTTLPIGPLNWRAKGPTYLANAGSFTLTGGQTMQVEMGVLRSADLNGDNAVTLPDFNLLKSNFGAAGPGPLGSQGP